MPLSRENKSSRNDPSAMRFRGLPILTNTTPRGAQRGPGQNQIAAVMAPIMDKAAKALDIDPVEIRKINSTSNETIVYADRQPVTSAYMREALDKGAEMFTRPARKASTGSSGLRRTGSCISIAVSATSARIPMQ